MLPRTRFALAALLAAVLAVGPLHAAGLTDSLKKGTPDLKSIGPLAFGPEGILFIGDPQGGAIFAVATEDKPGEAAAVKVEGLDGKIASLLGIDAKQLLVNGLAVNPASGSIYLSVTRGKGPDAMPVLLRADGKGKIDEVSLKDVPFAKATLPNPPDAEKQQQRRDAITCLAYARDKVYVAGLSNEEFASKLRAIPFPFAEADKGASVEIYHGSHGQFETRSPVRTFVPYDIKGESYLLAAYTCTPLVKIPVTELKAGEKVKGTTIAELGNGNQPLDMIVYQKGGKDYILLANSKRGVMKITTDGIDTAESITKHIDKTAGLPYDTVASLKGVLHLAKLDKDNAVLLVRRDDGSLNLETVALP
jgi:hypothetical protein